MEHEHMATLSRRYHARCRLARPPSCAIAGPRGHLRRHRPSTPLSDPHQPVPHRHRLRGARRERFFTEREVHDAEGSLERPLY
jgi:hypothetical protein